MTKKNLPATNKTDKNSSDSGDKQDSQHDVKQAVALLYDGDNAPTVSATGMDELAQEIINWAEENDIPLHEDPDLITLLSQLELGDEIPESLYRVVAEVIAFAYLTTGKTPPGYSD